MNFIPREQWGAPAGRSHLPRLTGSHGLALHYNGPAMRLDQHGRCDDAVRSIRRFHTDVRGWLDIAYCVDEDTEIFTDTGWRRYNDVPSDIAVLTLNHETGMSEWQRPDAIHVFPARQREMVRMEGREHSSLTTPHHRWAVERTHRRTGRKRKRRADGTWTAAEAPLRKVVAGRDRTWTTSEDLGYWDSIPVAAECASLPDQPKYADAFVELVAWFWTEGHIRRGGRQVEICQSHAVNEPYCDRIRAALTATFGPPVDTFPRAGRTTDGVPRWREYANGSRIQWYLSADAGDLLVAAAPGRVVRHDFIRSLTRAQLDLFVDVSMKADGSGRQMLQKDPAAAEAFAFAAILAGHAVSYGTKGPTTSTPYEMSRVQLMTKRRISPRPAANNQRSAFSITREMHDGTVWCPQTPNGTWLARRNGKVYFTGNSFLACPHGWVYEGRGWNRRSAANGTNAGNSWGHAVMCLIGGDEQPSKSILDAVTELCGAHDGRYGRVDLRPHSSFKSTACPGDPLRRFAASGDWRNWDEGDDMALSDADVEKIAGAVVKRLFDEPIRVYTGPDKGETFDFERLIRRMYQQQGWQHASIKEFLADLADAEAGGPSD